MFILVLYVASLLLPSSASGLNNKQWSSKKLQAFHIGFCLSNCQEDINCKEECRKQPKPADGMKFPEFNETDFHEPANFNATLHCKDTTTLKIRHNPGIWVIEQISRDNSTEEHNEPRIQVTDGSTTSTFTNLTSGTAYRYEARRILKNSFITEAELSPWFQTLEMGHRSKEIKNLVVTSQQLDDVNPSRVRVGVAFEPASDRSCRYEIVSFNEAQGLTIGSLESSQDFRFSLHDLDFRANMSVFVTAANSGNAENSKNSSLYFVTPSCLDLRQNLTFCAPDKVTGLRADKIYKNGTSYSVIVEWDKPLYPPDNYTIEIQPLDHYSDTLTAITSSLPGNATEALLLLDEMGKQRERIISIIAESAGGASPQAWIPVNFDETDLDTSPGKINLQEIGLIVVPSVAVVVLLLTAFVYWRFRSEGKNTGNKSYYKNCQNLQDNGRKSNHDLGFYILGKGQKYEQKDPLLAPMIDKFEIRPSQLTISDILGSGASGIVRLGTLQDSSNRTIDVAIKMLKDDPTADDLKNFQQEIAIMKSVGHHQSIVSIIGCCTLDVPRPMLVVEYCSQGDLQTYLRSIWQEMMSRDLERKARSKIHEHNQLEIIDNNVENLTYWIEAQQIAITNKLYDIQEEHQQHEKKDQSIVVDLLSFARQVASGMEFLSSNRVIHRDLAARNVLLCDNKVAKISDFGLSRDIYQENVYKKQGNGRLPLKWMAIEALTHQIYTTQSDVWSFGILLWEIVTLGCNPYPETPTNMVLQLLKSGYRMEKPDNCGNELYNIMLSCWRSRPRRRPNFTQLKNQLEELLRTASDSEYLNLYDVLREPATSGRHESLKLVEMNDYSNIYST